MVGLFFISNSFNFKPKNFTTFGKLVIFSKIYIFVINSISEATNEDEDNLSDAESVHDYDQSSNNSSAIQSDKLPIEILEPIKSFGLVEKLWQRAQPLAENVNDILKVYGLSTYKK